MKCNNMWLVALSLKTINESWTSHITNTKPPCLMSSYVQDDTLRSCPVIFVENVETNAIGHVIKSLKKANQLLRS
jgi:hypothetical protein